MLEGKERVHLIGIAGAGMRAIAQILIEKGFPVSGSDQVATKITEKFSAMGATIYIGHDASHVEGADVVVISTAIPKTNPELIEAKKRGLMILHRSDIVKYILDITKGIAVAGAHGKTTTTSMIGQILMESGMDPTVIIGGEVDYLQGNSHLGTGVYSVVEADESDGSFQKLSSSIAVITNIENDHMDHYHTMENLLAAFKRFLSNLQPDGIAVVCGDNAHIKELIPQIDRTFLTYGIEKDNDFVISDVRREGLETVFTITAENCSVELRLRVPGMHNVLNATASYIVSFIVGAEVKDVARALLKFTGAKRRFETKGKSQGVWVVDDYAHHPTEIKATLKAAKEFAPGRVICVFQPHRYTRTELLLEEYASCFVDADVLIITDIYSAGEAKISGIDGYSIPKKVEEETGQEVIYIEDMHAIPEYIAKIATHQDVVITMGAGNINTCGPQILERLDKKEC